MTIHTKPATDEYRDGWDRIFWNKEVKRTYITTDEVMEQQDRPGFTPVCRYGKDMLIERNEIGAITRQAGEPVYQGVPVLYTIPVEYLERIFIKDSL